jgi:DNA polymerase-3 subunit delta
MKNLYLFYGNDKFAIQKEIKKWISGFLTKDPDGSNLSILKENEFTLNELLSESFSIPFLSEKRLIICHQAYKLISESKKFFKKIAELPESSVVVFVETDIKKNSVFIKELTKLKAEIKEFTKSNKQNIALVNSLLKTHNKQLSSDLIEELIYGLDENASKIEQELTKLILFSQNDQITKQELYQVVNLSPALSVFKITDHICSKNHSLAIKTLNELISKNEDLIMLFYLIAKHFRNLILIKDLTEKNFSTPEIEKFTTLKTFTINNLKYQIKNFSFKTLEQTLNTILDIDTKIKTGKIKYSKSSPEELLFEIERMILSI